MKPYSAYVMRWFKKVTNRGKRSNYNIVINYSKKKRGIKREGGVGERVEEDEEEEGKGGLSEGEKA